MSQEEKAIATIAPITTLPSPGEWQTITGMAAALVPTGFLPSTITKPEQAAAIMLKGRELGVPPMYALSNINVIKGKPVANAELMLALVKRAYGRDTIWIESSTDNEAKVGYLVHGKPKFYSFTGQMAANAGLGGDNWKKYPGAMLRARAISAVCRMEFPEVIAGMYSPGELGEAVEVDDDGVVTTATISESTAVARDVGPQRAEPPAQGSILKAVEGNAQGPNTRSERETLNASLHARLPHDLLHELAVGLWKKDSFKAMTVKDLKSLDLFVRGEGEEGPQSRFDTFVKQWEHENAEDEADEDGVIEAQATLLDDELNPSDEQLGRKPASAFTR